MCTCDQRDRRVSYAKYEHNVEGRPNLTVESVVFFNLD